MPPKRPPHVVMEIDRLGNRRWYHRVGKGKRTRLPDPYGSGQFWAVYNWAENAANAELPTLPKAGVGTLAWAWDRYRKTAAWAAFSTATRRQRENVMTRVLVTAGTVPLASFTRKAILGGIDKRAGKPAAQKHFLQVVRSVFSWALDAEHIKVDPTAGIKVKRPKTDGYAFWTDDECERFEQRWPLGTRERLAFDILLYTGLRRGDAVRLGRQHLRNGVATLKTQKTGETVEITFFQPLIRSITAGPCGDLTYIIGEGGKPLTKESFGNWFRLACNAAGVPGSAHGLRKVGATRAAEAGASEHELMAMFGWSDPRTAAIYTRKANRARLSKTGAAKVQTMNETSPHLMGSEGKKV